MSERQKINDNVTVGAQVSEEEVKRLPQEGFRTVVNLREPGEQDQPVSPDDERKMVEAAGMKYLHIPVSGKDMKPEQVDRFRQELMAQPGPVFVHCHKGKRAGAFAMMAAAVEQGWSGDQTLQTAEQMGFKCDTPQLKEFVKGYVDRNVARNT
jgi:uncharacterized protein (TIGR01244 family)